MDQDDLLAMSTLPGDEFMRKCHALRDVVENILPAIAALDSLDKFKQELDTRFKFLKKDEMLRVVSKYIALHEEFEGNQNISGEIIKGIFEEFKAEPWGPRVATEMHEWVSRPSRKPVMLELFVVSAVSSFEVLMARLVDFFFRAAPEALENVAREREKEFSLKDLKTMDSIDDAVDLAISRRVDEIMFGSFADWRKFFLDRMNIKFEDCAVDWNGLKETFQRRHILVHNGGMISKRYLSNISNEDRKELAVGGRIVTDEAYVRTAIDSIATFGTLLSASVQKKFCSRDADVDYIGHCLNGYAYKELQAKRYSCVSKMTSFIRGMELSDGSRLTAQVNNWIARDQMIPGSVNSEVTAWDVSALGDRYKLAKYCLLGEVDEAVKLARSLYGNEELSVEDVLEWPLFDPIRNEGKFGQFVETLAVPEEWFLAREECVLNPAGIIHKASCRYAKIEWMRIDPTIDSAYRRCRSCFSEPDLSL
ncbi:hypothetical protein ACQFX6_19395 [Streptomyces sp. DSM 41987]|uniref:hypothetical protein n=1 Tax=Streptomyces TaxID=1883 RepID=UPI00361785FF